MINKRGSHVGMILSFLVFMTFVGFLYSVIEPATRSQADKLDLMKFLKIELLKEFSADMSTLTIKIPVIPRVIKCVSFPIPDIDLEGRGVVAKDIDGNLFPSHVLLGRTEMTVAGKGVFKIYYSEEFGMGVDIGSCTQLTEDMYEVSLFKTDEEIFGSKILNVSELINLDQKYYEELKQKFGVGVGEEFGFVFNDENKNFISGTEEKNVSTDIFVEELPIQYIDSEANIKSGFLNIKVW